jgi:N-acetylglucosamine-6-phosphate deacetylase
MTVLSAAKVVTADGVLEPGWVSVRDGRIERVGQGRPDRSDTHGHAIVPGFVDVHCHGGGGASFDSADHAECRRAAAFHSERGTTTLVASLVSAAPADLLRRAGVLAELADDGVIAGIHYEGPFLSAARRGAHDPDLLRDPDKATLDRLLRVRHVRMMTVAPELDGGLDALRRIRDAGALAAVGHTDATYEVGREAARAGARVATHLFNGMRPLHHREPGPILAMLEAPDVVVELIADGVHLHPSVVAYVARTAGAARTALVTDAMAAAGMADGAYRLGGLGVEVTGGVARLAGGGSIAGGTATAAAVFRHAVAAGVALADAARISATTPARLLGLADRGAISPGLRADLVVLDADLNVQSVVT